MGQGGQVILVNGTAVDWNLSAQQSTQMNSWGFPATIAAGTTAAVYVEWNQHIFTDSSRDSGTLTYTLAGTQNSFQLQASATTSFDIRVVLSNIATSGNPAGSTIDLGWSHNGSIVFVLTGGPGNYISTNQPAAWMQSQLPMLGGRTIRELCMPGTHDAGMSTAVNGTAFAPTGSVQTQTNDIGGQLRLGSRYFDIRPVISGGTYTTGHYSQITVKGITTWQGAAGQTIASIIDEVNAFTAANAELVILNLSHDYNTDVGNSAYRPLNQQEWNGLLVQLQGLNGLFIADPTSDLTAMTLADFIGGGKAAVVVVVDPGAGVSAISLGSYLGKGFYYESSYTVFNSYADSNSVTQMASDQLTKMKQQRTSPQSGVFLLSWTLTQSSTQAVLGTPSILDLAAQAYPALYQSVPGACSSTCYPNILYIDGIQDTNVAALAMLINGIAAPAISA